MPGEHELQIALATALREAREAQARVGKEHDALVVAESERDSLRTALQDIVTLCMDVPATADWRAKVGDRARKALHGKPGWKET